jgi:hypothetical protein
MLGIFGEQGEGELGIAVDVSPERVAAIGKLFPEANIFPRSRPAMLVPSSASPESKSDD